MADLYPGIGWAACGPKRADSIAALVTPPHHVDSLTHLTLILTLSSLIAMRDCVSPIVMRLTESLWRYVRLGSLLGVKD